MSNATTAVTEGDILSHAIETIDQTHWNQVAHLFSKLKLPERDLDRVDQLLKKNSLGAITDPERAELEKYLRVGNRARGGILETAKAPPETGQR